MQLALAVVLILLTTTSGLTRAAASPPALEVTLRDLPVLDWCGEKAPMQVPEVRERFEKALLLSAGNRPQVLLWLKRSRRYFPIIETMLAEQQMPDDLKYVAVAESALRPHAGSPKGALGFWQFMAYTGRKYGLIIDTHIDQRRNIFTSTTAAVRYLQDLHAQFGSWTLAAAAYNMGEEGLKTEILMQKTRDYYRLYLPLETQQFVLRLLAIKLIMTAPERFGLRLRDDESYPPFSYTRVTVELSQETPIQLLAQAAQTTFKTIKDLNPELRGYYLAAGTHTLLLPGRETTDFEARIHTLTTHRQSEPHKRIYVVKAGDNLSAIADRFNVPLAALLIWNRLDPQRPIHAGKRLIIYSSEDSN